MQMENTMLVRDENEMQMLVGNGNRMAVLVRDENKRVNYFCGISAAAILGFSLSKLFALFISVAASSNPTP